jgi:threonine/homoserine/homoserine lactone efflux protein
MGLSIVSFLIYAVALVGTPGPANMILLATGARYGLRGAIPFISGVIVSKQFIIWPIGLGVLSLATAYPAAFSALKWLSAAYILWLAWKIAGGSLHPGKGSDTPPSFKSGLLVHPLNPKAWAMVTGGFANFTDPSASPVLTTFAVAVCLVCVQSVLHPAWAWGGEWLAKHVAGTPKERFLMITLAVLTVASVVMVLAK